MKFVLWSVVILTLIGCDGVLSRVAVLESLLDDIHSTVTNLNNSKDKDVTADVSLNEILPENDENNTFNISDTKNCTSETGIDGVIQKLLSPCEMKPIDNGTALILTPFLEQGNPVEARSKSRVNPLLFLGVESYSGFFTVNKTYNSNMFFWYFPSLKRNVTETPLVIWLQGGPGASSMTGLFDEIGPFRVFNNTLRANPFTWLKEHSLLFIDNPVGTGFSFTDHDEGFATSMETYSEHLYSTVNQFLQVFPELRTAPLYIAGESYAGKYVPALGRELHEHKVKGLIDVNLQGFIIGNGFVDPDALKDLSIPMMYVGLLLPQQITIIRPLLDSFRRDIEENNSLEAKRKWGYLISVLLWLTHQEHSYNFLRDSIGVGQYVNFLKESEVKRALHVGDINFENVNFTVNIKLAPDFLWKSAPVIEDLLDHYRVLLYCGHLDMMLPCVYSSQVHAKWKWSQSSEFQNAVRYPYIFRKKLSGYYKSGGNLTELVVRGAGHMVPLDAPAAALDLATRFTTRRQFSVASSMYEGTMLRNMIMDVLKTNKTENDVQSIYYL